MILGIDEVGRGPWAGPLVVGAVVLAGSEIEGLNDSKALSKKQRATLDSLVRDRAADFGLGWVSAVELDEIGLSAALRLATRRAVRQIHVPFHEIIIDGTVNFLVETPLAPHVKTLKKADALVPSVSAASIIAKVARDNFMAQQDAIFPGYGFGAHVGYGTAKHRAAIEKLGVTPLHRLSFAPLQKYQKKQLPRKVQSDSSSEKITTRAIGNASETSAAEALTRRGHEILARNWRTRWCEIDIVSRKAETIYFTEVKHRKNAKYGDGISAITPQKLRQMRYAAEFFAHSKKLTNVNLRLLAVATTGDPPEVTEILEA